MNDVDFEIRFEVARYLAGEVSVIEFRRWFLPVAWRIGEPGASGSAVGRRVELRLAEFDNGHWTEDELRGMLRRLIGTTAGWEAVLHVSSSGTADNVRTPVSTEGLQLVG